MVIYSCHKWCHIVEALQTGKIWLNAKRPLQYNFMSQQSWQKPLNGTPPPLMYMINSKPSLHSTSINFPQTMRMSYGHNYRVKLKFEKGNYWGTHNLSYIGVERNIFLDTCWCGLEIVILYTKLMMPCIVFQTLLSFLLLKFWVHFFM